MNGQAITKRIDGIANEIYISQTHWNKLIATHLHEINVLKRDGTNAYVYEHDEDTLVASDAGNL